MNMQSTILSSPLGYLEVTAHDDALTSVAFVTSKSSRQHTLNGVLKEAVAQLEAYFKGRLNEFDLPLNPQGTEFQKKVWRALQSIPCGKTISYADLARRIRQPQAFRAVGGANGKNPIPLIVPCHRVINADGGLGGFSCGLDRKRWLLNHEAQAASL